MAQLDQERLFKDSFKTRSPGLGTREKPLYTCIVSDFAFHPELFEQRTLALEALAQHDYNWFEHFSSVDLLHDLFGLEVCGVEKQRDAEIILSILEEVFPDWRCSDIYYYPYERDRGWKAIIFKNQKRRKSFTTA